MKTPKSYKGGVNSTFLSDYWSLLSSCISSGKISIDGLRIVSLLAILRSNDNKSVGSRSKLESIANNKVIETNPPKATVPPKLEIVNTENPKNNTIDV